MTIKSFELMIHYVRTELQYRRWQMTSLSRDGLEVATSGFGGSIISQGQPTTKLLHSISLVHNNSSDAVHSLQRECCMPTWPTLRRISAAYPWSHPALQNSHAAAESFTESFFGDVTHICLVSIVLESSALFEHVWKQTLHAGDEIRDLVRQDPL